MLKALRQQLPHEHFVYFADTAHAPYGSKTDAFIAQRCQHIADTLIHQHHVKALVVACNTATAAAVHTLRSQYPNLPIIGMEPALKPAALASKTRHVAVLATQSTLQSRKFQQLLHQIQQHTQVRFHLQAAYGLVQAIEQCGMTAADDATAIQALCDGYMRQFSRMGHTHGAIDQLVLGCTHYIWAAPQLRQAMQTVHGCTIPIVHTAEPVARHTAHTLTQYHLHSPHRQSGRTALLSSNNTGHVIQQAQLWL